jgi:hypothetical protein
MLPPHWHVRHESEPHLWTADEIRRVLAVIDRQSATGKRDYAMNGCAAALWTSKTSPNRRGRVR